jgi:hypothetical protein
MAPSPQKRQRRALSAVQRDCGGIPAMPSTALTRSQDRGEPVLERYCERQERIAEGWVTISIVQEPAAVSRAGTGQDIGQPAKPAKVSR